MENFTTIHTIQEEAMNPIEMITVIASYIAGKAIQVFDDGEWYDTEEPTFNFRDFLYRVKPD